GEGGIGKIQEHLPFQLRRVVRDNEERKDLERHVEHGRNYFVDFHVHADFAPAPRHRLPSCLRQRSQLQLLVTNLLAKLQELKDPQIGGPLVGANDDGRLDATGVVPFFLGRTLGIGVDLPQVNADLRQGAQGLLAAGYHQLAVLIDVQEQDVQLGLVHGAGRLRNGQLDVFIDLLGDEIHADHEEHDELEDEIEQRDQIGLRSDLVR